MFFEYYLLGSYNAQVGCRLLINCKCYRDYNCETTFIQKIINERQSYMGCIAYESKTRKRVGHRSVPIMLGSYIDFRIRGKQAVQNSRAQWGAVILKGMAKFYPSFSTFDALSMHMREKRGHKIIEWYTYVDGEGLAIRYENKTVEWTFRRETNSNNCPDQDDNMFRNNNEWVALLNKANPFITNRTVLASEYITMFDIILTYPYDMNDLKNRQLLNGATIINKYIDYDLAKRKKKMGVGCQKMSTAFEQGSLYIALSKKNNTCESEEWSKSYPQNYDSTLHEGRSNKTAHYLQNVIRASNDAVRNSRALAYPRDAFGYFCPLNTKDLKSAGEQNVLADYVIMTEESDEMQLFHFIKTDKILNVITTKATTQPPPPNCMYIIIINGFFTDCYIDWSMSKFIRLKQEFPHVTTNYYKPYILLSTKASIPIKYHDKYDIYFSPAETTEYKIMFPEMSYLSLTAKTLDRISVRKTPSPKSTVAINNIKGCIANIQNEFHYNLMRMSLGTTSYIDIDKQTKEKIMTCAVLGTSADTKHFHTVYRRLDDEFNLQSQLQTYSDTASNDIDQRKATISLMTKLYDQNNLLVEYIVANGMPYDRVRNVESRHHVETYVTSVFGKDNFDPPPVWNLRLWASFGNVNGACVEDGVVLDRKTVDQIPPIHYNACITVDFTFATTKQSATAKFVAVNDTSLKYISSETLIGCLISEREVFVKNSKHCNALCGKIGNHYYYLLHFLPKKNNTYTNLNVHHILSNKVLTVIVTGVHEAPVGVGTKFANSFGQKNICSQISDLSSCWGVTRDGRKVHAQIVYSSVSLIGRVPSGQVFNMLTSDDLAIGPNGEIIAPVDLVIHYLHPYTNIKVFDVKVDTLTNVNGFDSQCLANVSRALRMESVQDKVLQLIGLHGFKIHIIDCDNEERMVVDDDDDEDKD
ncbi:uncharacterized protein LOC120355438 [Nilaparvata lugens]|uniref:uncharacterized protein LOC120355438 n=1 Tax=Nilaparvata lugens TaxID=108931 RepID=UPI00193EB3CE|nr:uncharacterized protein LOC120355438 [Nilaparvata lugens]